MRWDRGAAASLSHPQGNPSPPLWSPWQPPPHLPLLPLGLSTKVNWWLQIVLFVNFPTLGINPAVRKVEPQWRIAWSSLSAHPQKSASAAQLQLQKCYETPNKSVIHAFYLCIYVCCVIFWILARHQTFVCGRDNGVSSRLASGSCNRGPCLGKDQHTHRQTERKKEHVGRSGPERSRCSSWAPVFCTEPWSPCQVCLFVYLAESVCLGIHPFECFQGSWSVTWKDYMMREAWLYSR